MMLMLFFSFLCMLGFADSLYLYYKSVKKHQLVCPLKSHCNVVLNSRWNRFLGIKNEVWGALYYAGVAVLGFGAFRSNILEPFLIVVATGCGFLYSLYLTRIQIFKIKEYCLYCLFSALISLLLFLVAMGMAL